jgi:uncharacterized membrane protein
MVENEHSPRISRSRAAWLETQSSRWVALGLIGDDARTAILGSFEVESSERRSMLALLLLGALMFGIGVLLLIGYNWARIPVNGKVAIIMSSVALAFSAAAVAYARRHPAAGETLALIGVLLYGNAIWLIAQVLHIQGEFPDAFLWWAIGALACAALVRSTWIGVAGAVLVFIWVIAAGFTFSRPLLTFVILCPLTMLLSYGLRSPLMLRVAGFAAAAWTLSASFRHQPLVVSVGSTAVLGCALFAIGAWHNESSRMRRAWHSTGLTVLLVSMIPLLTSELHEKADVDVVTWSALLPVLPPLLVAATLALRPKRPAEIAVGITAALTALWLVLIPAAQDGGAPWLLISGLFNLLALALSVSLIRTAVVTDRLADLAFGVLFGLAFLVVRWVSLIDNLFWSGLILIAASAGLFLVARIWRHRGEPMVATGVAL